MECVRLILSILEKWKKGYKEKGNRDYLSIEIKVIT
jgi:hypothetical protein